MAVGTIAERYLTPQARQAVDGILNGERLGDHRIANWPDFIRGNREYERLYPHNNLWHYIDVDVATPQADFTLPANGEDVVDQVARWQNVLGQRDASAVQRRDALRFLDHFVGDLHQPLHCALRNEDRGGNLLPIHSFRGEHFTLSGENEREHALNLHKVWDECLVAEAVNGGSFGDFVNGLEKDITPDRVAAWQKGTPKDWAWDTHTLAVTHAYRFADGTALPHVADGKEIDLTESNYIAGNVPIVREQLEKAAVRLARLINEALGGAAGGPVAAVHGTGTQ